MGSAKFDKLAAEVHSKRLAGWITTHNPKVAARAKATRARKAGIRKAVKAASGSTGRRGAAPKRKAR
jgi:hypothetical protein